MPGPLNQAVSWIRRSPRFRRGLILLAILGGLYALGRLVDVDTYLQLVQQWIWQLGPWGPVVYGALYVAATLLTLPGTPLTILAALLFGVLWGFITMVLASTAAAAAGFLIARYLAKDVVRQKLLGSEAFDRLMARLEGNHWFVIPTVRLLPIFPFALNNYALGLTEIGFWRYLLLSELVMLPMNALLVLLARFLYELTIKGELPWTLLVLFTLAGLLLAGLGLLVRQAVNQLRRSRQSPADATDG